MPVKESISELARITPTDCMSRSMGRHPQVRPESAPGEALSRAPEEVNARETARQAGLALAVRDQRAEIIRHLYAMVLRRGEIVTVDEAARDWIPNHAAAWRARHEADLHATRTAD